MERRPPGLVPAARRPAQRPGGEEVSGLRITRGGRRSARRRRWEAGSAHFLSFAPGEEGERGRRRPRGGGRASSGRMAASLPEPEPRPPAVPRGVALGWKGAARGDEAEWWGRDGRQPAAQPEGRPSLPRRRKRDKGGPSRAAPRKQTGATLFNAGDNGKADDARRPVRDEGAGKRSAWVRRGESHGADPYFQGVGAGKGAERGGGRLSSW